MERFGELLFEAIDDTIRLVFGEFASDLIYGFVERHVSLERQEIGEKIEVFREAGTKVIHDFIKSYSHLEREEIAEKPEVFSTGLKRLLGSGAFAIERLILKNLYRKFALKFEEKEGYEFSDHIKEMRGKCGVERHRIREAT
jgi:hypothetical protein